MMGAWIHSFPRNQRHLVLRGGTYFLLLWYLVCAISLKLGASCRKIKIEKELNMGDEDQDGPGSGLHNYMAGISWIEGLHVHDGPELSLSCSFDMSSPRVCGWDMFYGCLLAWHARFQMVVALFTFLCCNNFVGDLLSLASEPFVMLKYIALLSPSVQTSR